MMRHENHKRGSSETVSAADASPEIVTIRATLSEIRSLRPSAVTKVTSAFCWQPPCILPIEFIYQETPVSKFSSKSPFAAALMTVVFAFTLLAHGDDAPRKIKSKVNPQYPELARKMNVSGSVRLELVVAANGQVKTVKPLGGHPLLIDAAQSAVKQWRYEPGTEATEVVEIRFTQN